MENILRSIGQAPQAQKRILELNASHAIIKKLITLAKGDSESEKVSDMIKLLYDQAMILEGAAPDDPSGFVKRVDDLMARALGD